MQIMGTEMICVDRDPSPTTPTSGMDCIYYPHVNNNNSNNYNTKSRLHSVSFAFSVHALRPGDVKVVAAVGDSLTVSGPPCVCVCVCLCVFVCVRVEVKEEVKQEDAKIMWYYPPNSEVLRNRYCLVSGPCLLFLFGVHCWFSQAGNGVGAKTDNLLLVANEYRGLSWRWDDTALVRAEV